VEGGGAAGGVDGDGEMDRGEGAGGGWVMAGGEITGEDDEGVCVDAEEGAFGVEDGEKSVEGEREGGEAEGVRDGEEEVAFGEGCLCGGRVK